jgi:HAD superfamily hydrolase (TIGR01509 family)
MARKRRVKYVLFNLDGTLIDSLSAVFRVYSYFMAAQGCKPTRSEFAAINGMSYREMIRKLREAHELTGSTDDLLEQFVEKMTEIYEQDLVSLRPETNETLDLLSNVGYRLGLVTGAEKRVVGSYVEKHFPGRFDVEVYGEDTYRSKPAPDPYLRALDCIDVKMNKVIAVEDSVNGITSASEAGLSPIGLAIDVPFSMLRLTHAKGVVTSLGELVAIILG